MESRIVSLPMDKGGLRAVLIAANIGLSLTRDRVLKERWTAARESLKGLARSVGWDDVVAELLASEGEEEQEEYAPS